MRVRVLFFGMLKDVTGVPEDRLELPDGSGVGAVFDHYAARHPRIRDMAGSIVMARNREFAGVSAAMAEDDEIAFLPPVSGGCDDYLVEEIREDGNLFALTRAPIQPRRILERVLRGDDGAVATFEGTVRNNTAGRPTRFLQYDGYAPMAVRVMAEIGRELSKEFAIGRVAMVHRLGHLLIGETSVLIVVTAPHRKAAFQAAQEAIDRLKRRVPIWKKEFFADGEVWVEGEWDQNVPVAQAR